jgi:hypothetical protein
VEIRGNNLSPAGIISKASIGHKQAGALPSDRSVLDGTPNFVHRPQYSEGGFVTEAAITVADSIDTDGEGKLYIAQYLNHVIRKLWSVRVAGD